MNGVWQGTRRQGQMHARLQLGILAVLPASPHQMTCQFIWHLHHPSHTGHAPGQQHGLAWPCLCLSHCPHKWRSADAATHQIGLLIQPLQKGCCALRQLGLGSHASIDQTRRVGSTLLQASQFCLHLNQASGQQKAGLAGELQVCPATAKTQRP